MRRSISEDVILPGISGQRHPGWIGKHSFAATRAVLPSRPVTSLVRFVLGARRSWSLCGLVAVTALLSGCHGDPGAAIIQLEDSRKLTADLRLQFNRADDASNRAVMADTDEASVLFAHDAENILKVAEGDVAALEPLLRRLGFPSEIRSLEKFDKDFAEYRKVDRSILSLAVENTNLKAQRLAFGPVRQAADGFRDSLGTVASESAPGDRCRVDELVAKAVLAVREIQVLQAPHIAESNDAAMTRMETEMAGSEARARDALKALQEIVSPNARPALAAAVSALNRFKDTSAELVTLSRRNTNVRSLELSLRTKPALAAACDADLLALQEALSREGSKATR